MTASVLKQDPNTKRFKRTLIYYDTHTMEHWNITHTYGVCVCVRACVRAFVRACVRARAGVSMCVWVLFC